MPIPIQINPCEKNANKNDEWILFEKKNVEKENNRKQIIQIIRMHLAACGILSCCCRGD